MPYLTRSYSSAYVGSDGRLTWVKDDDSTDLYTLDLADLGLSGGISSVALDQVAGLTVGTPYEAEDIVYIPVTSGHGTARLVITAAATATAWAAATAYSEGDTVSNGGSTYRCTTAGTSAGSGGPSGTTTPQTDNTVTWAYEPHTTLYLPLRWRPLRNDHPQQGYTRP